MDMDRNGEMERRGGYGQEGDMVWREARLT